MERESLVVEHLSKTQERESQLLAQVSAMQAENQALQEQLAAAQKRIKDLEKQKTPPSFVKAKVKKPQDGEKQQRKKRDAQHNHSRQRLAPTRRVDHLIKHCPVCASAPGG